MIDALKNERYTHVYDAHNNLRSSIISFFLRFPFNLNTWTKSPAFLRKPQNRWKRFLLFKFRINKFEKPFSGQRDLLAPLKKWGLPTSLPEAPQIFLPKIVLDKERSFIEALSYSQFIAIAPSSAHELKRWPVRHWIELIRLNPGKRFVCLGGKEDLFIHEISQQFPDRVLNLAGKKSLLESAALVSHSQLLITNDTGLLHVSEQLGKATIALMGPAPFGYPSRNSTCILERDLPCRPCSKHGQGPCTNNFFHECMIGISPKHVTEKMAALGVL